MAEVYAPRDSLSGPRNPRWCAAGVQKNWTYTQCSRAIQIEENGFGWCGIHSAAHEKKVEEARDRKYKEYTDKGRHAQHLRNVERAYVEFAHVAVKLLEQWLEEGCHEGKADCEVLKHINTHDALNRLRSVLNG